jgi:hypothetical protein
MWITPANVTAQYKRHLNFASHFMLAYNFNLNFFSSIAQPRNSGGQWTISSKYVHDQEVITSIQKLLQCSERGSSNITQYSPNSNSTCCQVLAHRHGNNRSK